MRRRQIRASWPEGLSEGYGAGAAGKPFSPQLSPQAS